MSIVSLSSSFFSYAANRSEQIGDFIQVSPQDMSLNQLVWHQDDFASQPGRPVYVASVMPMGGLKSFGRKQAEIVAGHMKRVNEKGITVWLRCVFSKNVGRDLYRCLIASPGLDMR